jgi:amidohydrolase
MIRAGALASPRVDAIIGVHVEPALAVGKLGVNAGVISAAADDFNVRITGKGGHGSSPHVGVDAIAVAAQFITTLQTIVSRRVSALDNVVVSIGKISGGDRHNIIAEMVELEGTIRTKRPDLREIVPAMVIQILEGTCAAFGATAEFEYVRGYPGVFCDPELTEAVRQACAHEFGPRRVVTTSGFEMGGEDFAYYAEKVPGTVILVGVTNKRKGKIHKLHNARFDLDEDALAVGVGALVNSALHCLSAPSMKAYFERWDGRRGYSAVEAGLGV